MTHFVRVAIFFLFFDFFLHVLHEGVLGVGDDHLPTAVTGTSSRRGSNASQTRRWGKVAAIRWLLRRITHSFGNVHRRNSSSEQQRHLSG